jgi:(2Fe-2S) ferredoxin
MAKRNQSPFTAHVFVCTNDRQGTRKSCADGASARLKSDLKAAVAAKGWQGQVRVSTSGCMGLCEGGPNVMVYPQKIWFSGAAPDALPEILAALERIMAGEA